MVKPVTIREAIVASLAPVAKRTAYKTDRRIEEDTAEGMRKNLCALFGLSSSEKMEVVRDTGVDVESPLQAFDKVQALVRRLLARDARRGGQHSDSAKLPTRRAAFHDDYG